MTGDDLLANAEELIKSTNSLYWALSLLSLREVSRVFSPDRASGSPGDHAAPGPEPHPMAVFSRLLVSTDAAIPRYAMKTGLEFLLDSAGFFQSLATGPENLCAWREFQNKVQAFYLFEHVDTILNADSAQGGSLPELIRRASALGQPFAVWATEGVGHYYTDLHLQKQKAPDGLLSPGSTVQLPARSMVPLHAGMGLSLAEFVLKNENCCGKAVEAFIAACRGNAHPDYLEASYEALGLVTRNLYPHLLGPIDLYLSQTHREIYSCFWHGVGRAIYFSPLNFLPSRSAPWAGIEMCISEPPNAPARRNAFAGFAWAMTLINIGHPEILALVVKHHGNNLTEPGAFINGVYSSLVVWLDAAGLSPHLESLLRCRPEGCDPELWLRFIEQPGRRALHEYPAISRKKRMGALFHVE